MGMSLVGIMAKCSSGSSSALSTTNCTSCWIVLGETPISELLDLSRLEMGQPLTLRLAPTNLVDLVGRAVVEHQQTTQRHDLRVETGEATLVGKFDAVRLGRVLDNLLGNAIKYSPDGGNIMVSVTREEITGGGYALLAVHDEGIGIPADDQPRVFERFQRARNAVGRLSGSGIGLANVRQIVEQHGGTIGLQSREGVGSTFTVRLPLRELSD